MTRIRELAARLRALPGVEVLPSAGAEAIVTAERALGVPLPLGYQEFLLECDGFLVARDAFRFHGVAHPRQLALVAWNDPALWKFTYAPLRPDVLGFLFVASDALGSQLGYRFADLMTGRADPPLYFFGAQSFSSAAQGVPLARVLQAQADRAGDGSVDHAAARALRQVGPLDFGTYAVPVPWWKEEDWMTRPAAEAMRLHGDYRMQLGVTRDGVRRRIGYELAADGTVALRPALGYVNVTGVVPYTDELGRSRVRLVTRPAD